MQTLKPGTRIELTGTPSVGGFPAVSPEAATIGKWTAKVNGPRHTLPGYHKVVFPDGGALLVHESRFRVTDNR